MKTRCLLLLGILFTVSLFSCATSPAKRWWNSNWHARVRITVSPEGFTRTDKPVEVPLDFTSLLKQLDLAGNLDEKNLRLVELDSQGAVLDDRVPFQFERAGDYQAGAGTAGTLVFICKDSTPAQGTRTYELYFDVENNSGRRTGAGIDPLVTVADKVFHEDQESIRIATSSATYYYHKAGGGFASLEDIEGRDWIGYRPCCESGGQYRGIPNLWKFHPGLDSCTSVLESRGPVRARIRSRAGDGAWECTWDIYPDYALMSLLKTNGKYWFLYEGTPWGSLEVERDYNVLSTGLRRSIVEDWHADIPAPEWVYLGDDSTARVIYLVHHEDDSHSDQFWQMRKEMVVFGFGRQYRCCDKYMDLVPAHFTVGFAEDSTFAGVEEKVNSAFRPVSISVGRPERR